MLFSGGGLALAFLSFGTPWKTREFFFIICIKDLFFSNVFMDIPIKVHSLCHSFPS